MNEYFLHLGPHFKNTRVSTITTERIKAYIVKRQQQGVSNGTINRETGLLKRHV
jgi:hypothetical protein